MTLDLPALVGVLLSAGGGAFLISLVRSWSDLRAGARAGQREVVKDLMEWREDLDGKLRVASADRDYWHDLAARRGAQLRDASIVPEDPHPIPPSVKEKPPAVNG